MNKVRLKYLTKEPLQYGINIDATNYKGSGIRFLRTTDLNDEGEIVGEGIYLDKENVPENYLLKKGDILFSRSGTIGRAYFHQTDEPMTYAGFLVRFRLVDVELAKWIYYYSKTPDFKYILNSEAIESTIQNFNGQKFNNIAIPINHLQLTINNYLDTQSQKINHFIAKKQQFIALLKEQRQSVINEAVTKGINKKVKLKDSGIKWLGNIPEHWEVRRLKNVCDIVLGKMLCNEDKGEYQKKPYLKSKNIGWDNVIIDDVEVMWFSEKELITYRIKRNDLLVSEGGEVGKTCIWKEELEECYIQNSVHKLTMFENCNPEYYLYWMGMLGYIGHFKELVNQVSIAHLTKDKIVKVRCLYPPLSEQTQIVNHIKTETTTIDTAIAKAEREIELIKEYKEAMIAEAVMGKVLEHDFKKIK